MRAFWLPLLVTWIAAERKGAQTKVAVKYSPKLLKTKGAEPSVVSKAGQLSAGCQLKILESLNACYVPCSSYLIQLMFVYAYLRDLSCPAWLVPQPLMSTDHLQAHLELFAAALALQFMAIAVAALFLARKAVFLLTF